jgi:two-component system sensor histidine kinase ArlS
MTEKLLNKTLRSYIIFSVIILGISAPSFYLFTQRLYLHETDETLELHQKEFEKNVLPALSIGEIGNWNKYNRNVKIEPDRGLKKTKIFSTFYYDTLDEESEPYRELNAPVSIEGKAFTYSGKINLIETDDLVESIFMLFLVVILVMLIGLFFITRILSRKLWKPFNKTLLQIEHFKIDKHNTPEFDHTTIDEFQRLNQSIQKLIARNILIYKSQREFVENAAHELQTPLAVFQAKLDTLSQFSNLNPQQADIIMELNNGIARLNRLNKNLLLLSKIENQNYSEKQELDLVQIIQHQFEFFNEQAKGKNIKISTKLDPAFLVQS